MKLKLKKFCSPSAIIVSLFVVSTYIILSYSGSSNLETKGQESPIIQSSKPNTEIQPCSSLVKLPPEQHAGGCQMYHLGFRCNSDVDPRDLTSILQLLLFHNPDAAFHLHISASAHTTRVITTLLQTWELTQVAVTFYPLVDPRLYNAIPVILRHLSPQVQQIIFIDMKMRFSRSIEPLWNNFRSFSADQFLGYVQSLRRQARTGCPVCMHDILLVDAAKARTIFPDMMSQNSTLNFLNHLKPHQIFPLPNSWFVELDTDYPFGTIKSSNDIAAFRLGSLAGSYVNNDIVEHVTEAMAQILSIDPDLYGHHRHRCSIEGGQTVRKIIGINKKSCGEYRKFAQQSKRTHLYYIGPFDISMLTQFSIDRFASLEALCSKWMGPIHAVLYGTIPEAKTLAALVSASTVLRKRKNIAYHVVFKRKKFYPINLLRNMLLKETRTPYLLFNDVDLIPSEGIYHKLQDYIETHMQSGNITLVIPAFEQFSNTDHIPRNRSELLQYIDTGKVVGYRMTRTWNLGHVGTDYPRWKTTKQPYFVKYKGAFEPYLVLASKSVPRYYEKLIERMGDKIAYGLEIFARGYQFLVLHDVFIVHFPHPKSEGTRLWATKGSLASCASILYREFKWTLQARYPDIKIP